VPAIKASPKTRLYSHVALPAEAVDQWNRVLMPQINLALRHFYRAHPESVEISLESIGDTPMRAQPTVLVVCTSVSKVRAILKKKLGILLDGTAGFGLKVCRGQVLRSRNRGAAAGRSMMREDSEDISAANPGYQERPSNGASIGAWIGDRHLPPVSFGGLIVVDGKPYGMTVHHMLDDPELDQPPPAPSLTDHLAAGRSMAHGEIVNDLASWYAQQYQAQDDESESSGDTEEFACEFSDDESESDDSAFSESDITSEASEDHPDQDHHEPEAGDIPGIEPGCGEGYIVTQPALDDVPDGFYPSPETQDEDHLDTYSLGEVYASSGIRRRADQGLVHEIDWALFEFHSDREPEDNLLPPFPTDSSGEGGAVAVVHHHHPTAVAPASSLPGLEVQCMARTSGLQTGTILPALTSVKIYGRQSPSHTYQITGTVPRSTNPHTTTNAKTTLPMGVPGDSGAWIVDRAGGSTLCGHVLAWSGRKRVAYICPMDVLLRDILETLGAGEVRLPGGEGAVAWVDRKPVEGRKRRVDVGARRGRVEEEVLVGGGDDGDDSYDEGVEVEEVDIAGEMGKLRLSGLGLQGLGMERMSIK